jgi:hypothetical protein
MSRTKEGNEYPLYIANKLRGKGYQTILHQVATFYLTHGITLLGDCRAPEQAMIQRKDLSKQ